MLRCAPRKRPSASPRTIARVRRVSRTSWSRARLGTALAVLALTIVAAAIALTRGEGPQRVEPVPRATTPAQQARNLGAWLDANSR